MTLSVNSSPSSRSVLRRSWDMIAPYRRKVFLGVFCALLATFFSVVSSYTLRILVDDILPAGKIQMLWPIQFVFIGAVFAGSLLSIAQSVLFAQASEGAQCDLRRSLFRRILDADPLARLKKTDAMLLSAVHYQVDALSGILENGIPGILVSAIDICVTLLVMLALDWRLTLLSLPVFPVLFLLNALMRTRVEAVHKRSQTSRQNLSEILTDASIGSDTVETYRLTDYILGHFDAQAASVADNAVRLQALYRIMGLISWTMIMVPYQAILYGIGGSWLIASGSPTIGLLLIFANFTNHLIQPVMSLTSISNSIGSAQAAFSLLDEFEDSLPRKEIPNYPQAPAGLAAQATGLTYSYDPHTPHCLENLSFRIPSGSCTLLWGNSGCGKSTLLKLLFQRYSLADVNMLSLCRHARWGYFPQEPHMLRLSLLEHFRLVQPDIREPEIWALLENFSVAEPIRRDPAGLDKLMRRTEGEFSLGEYRRLCLAVFWAADFDVLLLDEPTASLDAENIQAIVRAIARLKGGKTLIIASHDNALQANADRIIQL